MTYPKAIVISAALIAAAIVFAAYQPAQSAFGSDARYMLSSGGHGASSWIADTETGELRFCLSIQVREKPLCKVIQKNW